MTEYPRRVHYYHLWNWNSKDGSKFMRIRRLKWVSTWPATTFFAENWEPISQDQQNDFQIEIGSTSLQRISNHKSLQHQQLMLLFIQWSSLLEFLREHRSCCQRQIISCLIHRLICISTLYALRSSSELLEMSCIQKEIWNNFKMYNLVNGWSGSPTWPRSVMHKLLH